MSQAPAGDPFEWLCRMRSLDRGILMQVTFAQRDVYLWAKENSGRVRVTTPLEVVTALIRIDDQREEQRVHCRYLSASMDAAIWLGWYAPYDRYT